jgi:glycosyltransferase involved in cell wall biosynthesis
MKNTLLSIVIPTKDRYHTLFLVIESLLEFIVGDGYEIVIQDNTKNNTFALNYLKDNKNKKIKYFHIPDPLSVSDNTHFAIENSSGEYVTFIGDDDLVSPYILEIISLMEKNGFNCITYPSANFSWEGVIFNKKYAFHNPECLVYTKNMSLKIEKKYFDIEIDKMLKAGGVISFELLSLYHGIVKKDILDLVIKKYGTYVPGPSPDRSTAIAISEVCNEFGFINYPVTINGISKKSAGGMGLRGQHISRIEDVSWLPKDIIRKWDPLLPRIWTASTIYGQCIYELLSIDGRKSFLNYEKLYVNMYVKERKTRHIVRPFLISLHKSFVKRILLLTHVEIKSFLYLLLQNSPSGVMNFLGFIRGNYSKSIEIKGIGNPRLCMEYLTKNTSFNKL